jgi:hypothetical protein
MPSYILRDNEQALREMFAAGYSQAKMAKAFGVTQGAVAGFLKRRGFVFDKDANYRWLRHLTERQRTVLHGTLLGDGNLQIPSAGGINAHLQLKHSLNQKDWFMWKYSELRNLFNCEPRELMNSSSFGDHMQIIASSRCHPLLTEIHSEFYTRPPGECADGVFRKQITRDILDKVDDLALAVWFCDDGSRLSDSGMGLIVGGVSEQEYFLVRDWMRQQGFDPAVSQGSHCVTFRMHGDRMRLFRERIRPHVPECMAHKLAKSDGVLTGRPKGAKDLKPRKPYTRRSVSA